MLNKSKLNLCPFCDEIFMSVKTCGQESCSSVLRWSWHLNRVAKLQLRWLYYHLKVAGTLTCGGGGCSCCLALSVCCSAMQLSDCRMLAVVVKSSHDTWTVQSVSAGNVSEWVSEWVKSVTVTFRISRVTQWLVLLSWYALTGLCHLSAVYCDGFIWITAWSEQTRWPGSSGRSSACGLDQAQFIVLSLVCVVIFK